MFIDENLFSNCARYLSIASLAFVIFMAVLLMSLLMLFSVTSKYPVTDFKEDSNKFSTFVNTPWLLAPPTSNAFTEKSKVSPRPPWTHEGQGQPRQHRDLR